MLILGTFIEIVPVFYLTVPIFAAITLSFNQSLLHLYVVFVSFAGLGMITPPVRVGIYTAAGVINERKISPKELSNFKGCFITGTAAEITPVGNILDNNFEVCDLIKDLSTSYETLVGKNS